MTDFLDNLGNHQHQKMLREISNDDKTPKKRDSLKETEIFENEEEYEKCAILKKYLDFLNFSS